MNKFRGKNKSINVFWHIFLNGNGWLSQKKMLIIFIFKGDIVLSLKLAKNNSKDFI